MATFDSAKVLELIKDKGVYKVFCDLLDVVEGPEREALDTALELAYKAGYRRGKEQTAGAGSSSESMPQFAEPPAGQPGQGANQGPFSFAPQAAPQPIYQQPPTMQPAYQQPPQAIPIYQAPPVMQQAFQQPVQQPVFQQPVQQPMAQPSMSAFAGLAQAVGSMPSPVRAPSPPPQAAPKLSAFRPTAPNPSENPVDRWVKEIIARIKQGSVTLPVFSHVAKRVLDMLKDPDLNVQKLSREIKYDQTLSSKIINIANSAFYGGATQMRNLEQAIVKVGLLEIRKHLYSLATQDIYKFDSPLFKVLTQRLSNHATAAANAAFNTAKMLGLENQDSYLLMALFHDVGKLWLLMIISDVLTNEGTPDEDIVLAITRQLFAMAHPQMGARLMVKWKFDKQYAQVVAGHHESISPLNKEMCIVQFGNYLAKSIGFALEDEEPWEEPLTALIQILRLDQMRVEKLQRELLDFMKMYVKG